MNKRKVEKELLFSSFLLLEKVKVIYGKMGSDCDYFEIRRNPYLYACYILTFCSELILDSATEEGERKSTLSENYPSRLHFVRDNKTKKILELLTSGFLVLFGTIKRKRETFSNPPKEMPNSKDHEKLLKIIALLEFYGHYIRCPWDIKVDEETRYMDLSGLSSFTKIVLKDVIITRDMGGAIDGPYVCYGRYSGERKCFE